MKKKDYQTPTMNVVKLQHRLQMLDGSNKAATTSLRNYTWNDVDEE